MQLNNIHNTQRKLTMYGYILTAVAMILAMTLIILFFLKPGGLAPHKKERADEKKGRTRTKPSAEQVQPASELNK
ncbi:MAG TPA: hypothetical protein DEA90_14620 [Opitutae bacterium]|nr:hypothetical protein [Puniceicoccaceae bacterium]HBR95392.1 hypothetical protein [Opitutae bacterium]